MTLFINYWLWKFNGNDNAQPAFWSSFAALQSNDSGNRRAGESVSPANWCTIYNFETHTGTHETRKGIVLGRASVVINTNHTYNGHVPCNCPASVPENPFSRAKAKRRHNSPKLNWFVTSISIVNMSRFSHWPIVNRSWSSPEGPVAVRICGNIVNHTRAKCISCDVRFATRRRYFRFKFNSLSACKLHQSISSTNARQLACSQRSPKVLQGFCSSYSPYSWLQIRM